MEKIYEEVYCYAMVMEMQMVMEVAATAFASLGMALDGGFGEMKKEAREVFDKGETVYWAAVMSNVVSWQMSFMGTTGMVFLTCSITGGICVTAVLVLNVLGGVLVYREEFGGIKIVSTVMCGWGFCSYVYGLYVKNKVKKFDQGQGFDDRKIMNCAADHAPYAIEMAQFVAPSPHHPGV